MRVKGKNWLRLCLSYKQCLGNDQSWRRKIQGSNYLSLSNGCFNKCHATKSLKNFLTIGVVERWQDDLRDKEVTSAEVSGAEGYSCDSAMPQVERPHWQG